MKRAIPIFCLAAALAMPLFADAQSEQAAGTAAGQTVSVTGCLREAGSQPGVFVLIREGGEMKDQASTGGGGGQAPAYRLTASGEVDLKAHLGHKVEVTGTVSGGAASGRPEADDPSAGKRSSSAPGSGFLGQASLSVQSIKHLSDNCSSGE